MEIQVTKSWEISFSKGLPTISYQMKCVWEILNILYVEI